MSTAWGSNCVEVVEVNSHCSGPRPEVAAMMDVASVDIHQDYLVSYMHILKVQKSPPCGRDACRLP